MNKFMSNLKIKTSPDFEAKLSNYPVNIQGDLKAMRNLVLETAREIPVIDHIEETLKWGEPSYLVKKGSTIRIDWKTKTPHQYAMYFKCTSKLVETFKEIYGDVFRYENNRAILFNMEDKIPEMELKTCIELALTYHLVKSKPRLGK